ncbi:hypothetical protein A3K29_02855 [Candidatus Collierbacteria bacterium RIFOXYB2_FULL_46_14]|uniref:Glycosyltransferase RgtA/B/C/D-like domain-containing protein n=1 Tax=Candidatus Collierbacteria bacterium GW2011_GWA2_46_26 TaxID=1618381 RepID=A0A0G1PMG3_9BACT|nr:MAG: hypothetical protein UW29_C0004G0077 [Candidatus Collierbacteria bacterium GW2011_GWC2_44_13]KKU33872.1 MAG: hypothetical protein UX47_C0001G0155 [Candidatus Collierbacteria bacterium GW2011_GWA2_46_26]OGD73059.1 MAG: hypothetical protein A3K29_02855 [Candidatus Collierbacteria bacterium RIFOXYB2_FULL_46_14]OGD76101.1 MAG: hypothetical protein A3K43_02855 [Candidatus Collierbacteria bacterium RIFOXYA2_FULL_46_20]OGD77437.1 MAG: hypothetical protein A3K39_02855 [Candidatus Collierbacteri
MGKTKKVSLLVLLVLAVILASPLLVSSVRPDGSMLINGSGDNLWHLSLSAEVTKQFPPTFPGMSGVTLQNYHYFSDALWGILGGLTGLPIPVIYFQVGSLLVCFLLVWLVFKLAKVYSLNDFWSIVCVITTLFVGSAAFIKPLFIKDTAWSGNAFMLDQPYDQLINLHTGIGYILLILGTLFMFKWFSTRSVKFGYLAAAVLSLLFGFKIFFAIPIALAFGVTCLLQVKRSSFSSLLPALLLFVLSTLIYYLIVDTTGPVHSPPISFRPGWLLTKMVEDPERFSLEGFYLKYLHYQSKGNWFRITQMEIEKIIIYLLGNFWVKLLGLLYLVKTFRKHISANIFISLSILFSLSMPLFITPQPDPFNAVQFGQVAVLFTGFSLGLFLSSVNKGKLLLLLLAPVFIFSLSKDFFNSNKFHEYVITKDEYSALRYLKENTDRYSVVMVDPVFDNKKMKVTALAERRTFYSGGNIAWLLGAYDSQRGSIQELFFASASDSAYIKGIVNQYGINYIYTSTAPKFGNTDYPLVFSNPTVSIFQTETSYLD